VNCISLTVLDFKGMVGSMELGYEMGISLLVDDCA
jgi:hypothetical protein